MALIVDNRIALKGKPALHALIIGVSEYPHLVGGAAPVPDPWQMGQLTSAASTAAKIAEWLQNAQTTLPVPLGTLRLLLSPSPAEAARPANADAATLANVIAAAVAWRTDASTNRENHTFFYFAGHGIQRTKDDAVYRGGPISEHRQVTGGDGAQQTDALCAPRPSSAADHELPRARPVPAEPRAPRRGR